MMERELELPSWLTDALASDVSPPRGTLTKQESPKVGDIYVVTPGRLGTGANRLCAVLELDSAMETARVALLTNETEYACDWDVRMRHDELQLPYELMIECDIISSVWWTQLSTLVGHAPNAAWSGLFLAATTGDFREVDESRRGTPIHGPSDARWTFRELELSSLQALSAECMSRLIDGLVLDPGLVCALAEAGREEQLAIAAAISERAGQEMVTMDPGSLALLLSRAELMDPDSWAALQRIIESASGADVPQRSAPSPFDGTSLLGGSPAAHTGEMREAFDSLIASFWRASGSISYLLTVREVWAANGTVLYIESHNAPPIVVIAEMLR